MGNSGRIARRDRAPGRCRDHQGSFFGIIPEPEFELVVAKLLEDHGLVPAGFRFPIFDEHQVADFDFGPTGR
jgi:hypothetical protein